MSSYFTTPIYYVNGAPHIGHAYTNVITDILSRFHRLDGIPTLFLTGTDEHGQKVESTARQQGMSPKEFADSMSQNFRSLLPALNTLPDQFIRTTEKRHKEAAQQLWQSISSHIYLDHYKGFYSIRDEAFYQEADLVDGKAPTGAPVEWVEEPSYFFRLSAFTKPLLEYYAQHPDFIFPKARYNEVVRFVEGGLKDLSISRTSFNWGIPVPNSPDHILYVWIDALANYLTALGYPNTTSEMFTTYWPNVVHIIGKDILRFHAVYWPAFLMAAGLPLPKTICTHGWWTHEGEKISKSLGNTIDPFALVKTYGRDPVRYFLASEISLGSDGDFSRQAIINKTNSHLANQLGNLVQRVLSFIHKYADGTIPTPTELTIEDKKLMDHGHTLLSTMRTHMASFKIRESLENVWTHIHEANRYMDGQKPWSLRKTDPDRMHTVLYILCESIRKIGLLLQPYMPESAERILSYFGLKPTSFSSFTQSLTPGKEIILPTPLFEKL